MTRSFPFGLVLLIGLVGGPRIAHAADAVPKFDIGRGCKAETSDKSSIGETLASCVADEEHARDELAPQWSKFAGADKTACIRETSIDGTPSYVELQTCLEIASGVRSRR
jgi:hypothetical protein